MKKKRVIIATISVTALLAAFLVLAINTYRLYMEAEKAQKATFTGDVLIAGKEIVDSIDNELRRIQNSTNTQIDSNNNAHTHSKQTFLFDKKPVAVISEKTISHNGTTIIIKKDTTFFTSTDSLLSDSLLSVPALSENDSNQIQIISETIMSRLNTDSLTTLIQRVLKSHLINTEFDYCIYDVTYNQFLIPPKQKYDNILEKGYVFALLKDDNTIRSHYLVLSFPSERSFFLMRMGNFVIPIACMLVIILLIGAYTIVSLNRQKKNEEMKSDFINNMTHEFKTPISTISLACESLTDESIRQDKNTTSMFLSIIQTENNRLKDMVTNILQLAQLRKGQVQLKESIVDVHAILNGISQNIALLISAAGGTLEKHFDAEQYEILADKSHIENVLVNVIENAIKYSPQSPTINIYTSNDKNMLVIAVKDNGIGIAPKNIKKIFDEFYRIPQGNIHDTKGYGLGLNYVKKIVELHNGKITVRSDLKQGSTFTIYLPIKKILYGKTI